MKPGAILSELEREPVIFWGCTRSEIFSALRRGLLVGVLAATLLTAIAATFLRGSTLIPLWMVSMLGVTYLLTRARLRRIASLRAGRPLFYELHALIYRQPQFIQPAARYQRERNRSDPLLDAARQAQKRRRREVQDDEDPSSKVRGFVFPWSNKRPPLPAPAETAITDTADDNALPATADTDVPPATANALPNSEARAEPHLTLNKTDDQE